MPTFTTLDVETANHARGSICQIAMVTYEGGRIVHEWQSLVDPRTHFSSGNVAVHGIRAADVRGAPTFAELWPTIAELAAGRTLVAHNSAFDRSCLAAACADVGLAASQTPWLCTVRVARRAWADELPRFGLKAVAAHIGFPFRHHDALEDARACGAVLLAACERTGLDVPGWLNRVERPVRERVSPRRRYGHAA